MTSEFSLFLLTFIGEQVRIYTKLRIEETQADGEQSFTNSSPVVIQGVLLDTDGDYYYLGATPNQVTQAVKIKDVSIIQIEEKFDPYTELLDGLPIPSEDKDVN